MVFPLIFYSATPHMTYLIDCSRSFPVTVRFVYLAIFQHPLSVLSLHLPSPLNIFTLTLTHRHTYTLTHTTHTQIQIYANTHQHMYILYIYMHTNAYTNACIYKKKLTYLHRYIHTHTYTNADISVIYGWLVWSNAQGL